MEAYVPVKRTSGDLLREFHAVPSGSFACGEAAKIDAFSE
jgi:hypothetical protein